MRYKRVARRHPDPPRRRRALQKRLVGNHLALGEPRQAGIGDTDGPHGGAADDAGSTVVTVRARRRRALQNRRRRGPGAQDRVPAPGHLLARGARRDGEK